MPGRIDFDVSFENNRTKFEKGTGEPMRILLMGNFSGSPDQNDSQDRLSLLSRKIYPVDVDSFDTMLSRISPRLSIQIGGQTGPQLELEFNELEDFHPDSLFMRAHLFQSLRDIREKLQNRDTFPQAVEILQGEMAVSKDVQSPATIDNEADHDTFARLLGKRPVRTGMEPTKGKTDAEQLIQALVRPHIVPTENPLQQTYLDSVDEAISTEMRHLLHNQEFQTLESVWRSLHRLVSRLETGERLELYLLDVTKQELITDITEAKNIPHQSRFHQLLVEQGFKTHKAGFAIACDFSFGLSEDEISALSALGSIAADIGGPFLASASSEILGCSSSSQIPRPEAWFSLDEEKEARWQALRMSAQAAWLGLAMPRILLRLPYGAGMDEIDSFEFEEVSGPDMNHNHFLWGSPAYATAMLLSLAFLKNGLSMQPGDILDLEDLPAFVFSSEEGKQLMSCTETGLSEMTAEAVLERGIMPFVSYRNRNSVRLLQFRSLAFQAQSLKGCWA